MNPLKEILDKQKPSLGAWLCSGSAIIAESMASSGVDWVAVDMEHSPTGLSDIESIFASIERWNVSPIVRIAKLDKELACRLLDSGAHGLIISRVEDVNEFEAFSRSCLYPPNGKRGVGLGRANRWGDQFDDYYENFSPVLMPMVETVKGVGATEGLLELSSVDGIFLGPYDLSADTGDPGNFESDKFLSFTEGVMNACLAMGKARGIHQVAPIRYELDARIKDGFNFIAYGTDIISVRSSLIEARNKHGTTNG